MDVKKKERCLGAPVGGGRGIYGVLETKYFLSGDAREREGVKGWQIQGDEFHAAYLLQVLNEKESEKRSMGDKCWKLSSFFHWSGSDKIPEIFQFLPYNLYLLFC